ncbi:hypothetical protein KKA15_04675 [Patescibacteria group bacterium]|nr:hypothetical protein [Patescibacteria group bacterium]
MIKNKDEEFFAITLGLALFLGILLLFQGVLGIGPLAVRAVDLPDLAITEMRFVQIANQNLDELDETNKLLYETITVVEQNLCTDSDDGLDYNTKGTANKGSSSMTDHCYSDGSNKMYEKYCDSNGEIKAETYNCPFGCNDGACLAQGEEPPAQEPENCVDTDGGTDYYTKGTATKGSSSVTDYCAEDGTILHEKYCDSGGNMKAKTYNCDNGCSNGACLNQNQNMEQTQEQTQERAGSSSESLEYQALKQKIARLQLQISQLEQQVVELEKGLLSRIDTALTNRLRGRILLQVENNGEAWYVDKSTLKKFYLKDGTSAYNALQAFGLGITNADLAKIPIGIEDRAEVLDTDGDGLDDKLEEALGTDINDIDSDDDGHDDGKEVKSGYNPKGDGLYNYQFSFVDANGLRGKILLQVESRGEAWYVHPENGKRYYMKDGALAYQIMRFLSLGITNEDLRKIDVGEF